MVIPFIRNNLKMLEERAMSLEKVNSDYFEGQIALYETFGGRLHD